MLLAHAIQTDTETTGSMTLGSPKYRQIANRMVSEMRNGTYEVGDRLPTEHRLMAAFGVSRHTVRQATQLLKQMGVIEAHQGKGSVVVSKPSPPEFIERVHSVEAPVDKGTYVNRRLVHKRIVRADTELANAFGCGTDRDFLELQYLRNIVQKIELPAVFLKVWIDPMFGSIASLLETEGGTTRDAIVNVMNGRYEVPNRRHTAERFGLRLGRCGPPTFWTGPWANALCGSKGGTTRVPPRTRIFEPSPSAATNC